MQRKAPKWLDDIRRSAEFILAATDGKSVADYQGDALLRAAVERHFEIIGEAMGRLARDGPETVQLIPDYPRIIAFRNVLIHGYDLVDHAEVWNVVREHLPQLLEQVRSLLAQAPPEDG
jgi:uncharacterized protein with HEPN domain